MPTSPARRRLLALLALVVLVLSACGGGGDDDEAERNTDAGPAGDTEWEGVIEAAQEEGEVTIYSSQGLEQLEDLGQRFEDEYGIEVTVVRDIDANLITKIEAERTSGSPIADVWVTADLTVADQYAAEDFYTAPTGPAFEGGDYDAEANLSEGGHFVSSAFVQAFGWNTGLVPDGLEDIDGFLEPELAGGKVGIQEPTSAAMVDFYQYLEETYGPTFLEDLAAQEPRIYPGVLPIGEAVTSGEVAAGFVQPLQDEAENGAPVDSAIPETAWGARFNTGILADAPHPNAAQLLANFMITPAGQEAIAHNAASVLPDVEGAVATVDQVVEQDATALSQEDVDAYIARWREMFL